MPRAGSAWTLAAGLLTIRARTFWRTDRSTVRVVALVTALGAAVLVVTSLLHAAFAALPPEAAEATLLFAYVFVGLFQVVAAVRWGVDRLFLSTDIDLLLSTPVSHTGLVWARIVETATSSIVSIGLLTLISAAYVVTTGAPHLLAVAVVAPVLLALTACCLGILATLLVARVVPPSRLRAALAVFPAIIGMSMFALSFALGRPRRSAGGAGLEAMRDRIMTVRDVLVWVPSAWPAEALTAAGDGRWLSSATWAAMIIALMSALGFLAAQSFRRTFYVSWGTLSSDEGRAHRGLLLEAVTAFLSPVTSAIVAKDLRLIRRDLRHLLGLVFPALVGVYFVLGAGPNQPAIFFVIWAPLMLGGIATQAVSTEGRNVALLLSAPLRGRDILSAKLVATMLPGAVLLVAAVSAIGIMTSQPPLELAAICLIGMWLMAGVLLVYVSLTAMWLDFSKEKPQMSPALTFVPMGVAAAFSGLSVGSAAWAWGSIRGTLAGPVASPAVGVLVFSLTFAVCGAILVIAKAAAARIEALEVG